MECFVMHSRSTLLSGFGIYVYTHTHARARTHTHTQIPIHKHIHAYMHGIYNCMPTQFYTYTCTFYLCTVAYNLLANAPTLHGLYACIHKNMGGDLAPSFGGRKNFRMTFLGKNVHF